MAGSTEDDIDALRRDLADLSREFERRAVALGARIEALDDAPAALVTALEPGPADAPVPTGPRSEAEPTRTDAAGAAASSARNAGWATPGGATGPAPEVTLSPRAREALQAVRARRAKPLRSSTERLRVRVGDLLGFLGPVGGALQQVVSLMSHYRDEGKLPALLLALVGGAVFVLGAGYLLQYSFNEYLSPWGRVGLGVVLAVTVIAVGAVMSRRDDNVAELGASVIAVGLTLMYVSAYFAGAWYGLLVPMQEFAVVAGITVAAWYLAWHFETRVTTTLTIVGGAFAPLLLAGGQPDPLLYSMQLAMLAIAGVHLARRVSWRELLYITFALTAGPFEYALWQALDTPTVAVAVAAHVIFYVFIYALLFDGLRIRDKPSRADLLALVSSLFFLLLTLFVVIPDAGVLALLLFCNTLPPVAVIVSRISRGSESEALFLLLAGALGAAGLYAIAGGSTLALAWALEAVLLIVLGQRFGHASVRLEGGAMMVGALLTNAWQLLQWEILRGADGTFGVTWASLAGTLALLVTGLIAWRRATLSKAEERVVTLLAEVQSLWAAALFMGTAWLVWRDASFVLAIIPVFALLVHAARTGLRATEWLALLLFVFPAVEVWLGVDAAGSTRFTEQPLMAQVARVELFVSLWVLHWFYGRYYASGLFARWTSITRELFFLALPLFFLPSAWRRWPEWLPVILWVSCLIAWQLDRRVVTRLLRAELFGLLLVTGVVAILGAGFEYAGLLDVRGSIALIAGIVALGLIVLVERRFTEPPDVTLAPVVSGAILFFGIAIAALASGVVNDFLLGAAVASAYYFGLLLWRPLLLPLRQQLNLVRGPGIVAAILAVMLAVPSDFSGWLVVLLSGISITLFGWTQLGRHPHAVAARRCFGRTALHGVFHLVLVLWYAITLEQFGIAADGPAFSVALVMHATLVLFLTLRVHYATQLRFALALYGFAALKVVLYDMADFNMIEKIIGFMAIGALLIAAAWLFQRVRNQVVV